MAGLIAGCGGGKWDEPTDTTAPFVTAVAPVDGAANVPVITKIITAAFNEAMDQSTLTPASFTLECPAGTPVTGGTVSYMETGNVATLLLPAANLPVKTICTATITTAAKDLDGNALASNYVWHFTTGVAPAVNVNFTNSAIGVCTNKIITATFTEAMNPTTINSTTFTVTGSGFGVPGGTIAITSPTTATFTPTVPFVNTTVYSVTIVGGASGVKNAVGDPMAATQTYTFTAGTTTCAAPIDAGILAPYGIASYGGITNTGATKINGDTVLDPTNTCNADLVNFADGPGFGTCGGNIVNVPTDNPGDLVITPYYPDTTTANAVMVALLAKWNSITEAGSPGGILLGCGTIGTGGGAGVGIGCAGNATLPPGIYISHTSSTIDITGDLTLDGQGDPNAVFIFQAPSAAITATPGSALAHPRILLINGAKASNVWWEVGSSATIGDYTEWQGNILASASISMDTSATSCGRMLAGAGGSGAFTFLANTVSVPGHPDAPAGCQ